MRHTRPPAAHDVAVPSHDRAGSDDQTHRGEAVDRRRPGQQRQPRPVWPRQTRTSARPLALGDSELMAQHQDLRVLPPRLAPRQAEHRHRTGHDQENQLQAHKPKIIPPPDEPGPACPAPKRWTDPTVICRASAQVTQVFGTHKKDTGCDHASTPPRTPTAAQARVPCSEAVQGALLRLLYPILVGLEVLSCLISLIAGGGSNGGIEYPEP